jgi:Zn-dependent protease with chaperone function
MYKTRIVYNKIIFLIFTFFSIFETNGQNLANNYTPIRNYRPSKFEIEQINKRYDSVISIYKSKPKNEFALISKSFKEMSKNIVMLDSSKVLMKNDEITNYLNELKNRIVTANKNIIKTDYNVFTQRSLEPNAYNAAAKIVVVDLELISRLQTEEQLLFVICHEIGHDLLSHVQKGIVKYAEIINDKELKKTVKELNKEEYGVYRKTQQVVNKVVSRYMLHSRENELEADSLGFILYKNLKLPQNQCVNLLMFLDSIDLPEYEKPIDYHKNFDSDGFTLNEALFFDEEYTDLGGNIDSVMFLPDSLKTHPSCKERVKKIKKSVQTTNYVLNPSKKFKEIRNHAKFEIIEYLLDLNQFGLSLYYGLHLLYYYPDNIYLKNSILYSLTGLYEASLQHTFSYVSDLPDKHYPKEYNKYLIFINNLNAPMFKKMVVNYREKINFDSDNGDYSAYVNIILNKTLDNTINEQKLISIYETQHKDKYYVQQLKEKYPTTKTSKK